jgi:hypothetical protein
MPIDHKAGEQQMHQLDGGTAPEALRAAADLIESKLTEGWAVTEIDVTTAGEYNSVRVTLQRRLL